MSNLSVNLQNFFPSEELHITNILEDVKRITISLKSKINKCICPKCNTVSTKHHGTYVRKVQDLPILGKQVLLEINSYEYSCKNSNCTNKTIAESFNGFISHYSRMTERLTDFLCTLALETSCEGAARIAKNMNIKVSGDTIIVDEKTHNPIAILGGRDGRTLSNWLKNNKHIKAVTRDRASIYAKVIEQDLPAAMQIADRFHIHQNLLQAIKKALNKEIPSTIKIKNNSPNVGDCSENNKHSTNCG